MKNEIVKNDTLWWKIKKVLLGLFSKKRSLIKRKMISQEDNKTNNLLETISLKEDLEKEKQKRNLAYAIMNKRINIESLSDSQVNEMIIYFEQYINNMNNELYEIKSSIIKFRKKL